MVGFKFKISYKLQMADQWTTLGTLRIDVLSYQECMNVYYFEALVPILVFEELSEET